ncbi:hypothetical protein F2Q70_00017618 [Brassica cretica]|uniref:Uncharacterized protein n=2 Tax=Brassica TaxID=3705 RepID=A0A8S9I571_BRACR|nr:hypothetical protein F2Q70_00017618 [Brassica cretica]
MIRFKLEERGLLDRKDRSSESWRQVAINEAAMAVVAVNFPDLAGRELGNVRVKNHTRFKKACLESYQIQEGMLSRPSIWDHITVQLASRATMNNGMVRPGEKYDLLYHDTLSTIWAETSDNARSAARSLVLGGLSEKHHGLNNFWDIDVEALRILNMYYDRAKEVKSFPDSSNPNEAAQDEEVVGIERVERKVIAEMSERSEDDIPGNNAEANHSDIDSEDYNGPFHEMRSRGKKITFLKPKSSNRRTFLICLVNSSEANPRH